jgi:hypothetical protein
MSGPANEPPTEPGYYWAKAHFLGSETESMEPVRVELNPRFGITWAEFVEDRAAREPSDRLPLEWVFQVHAFGSELPYVIGDIEEWGPRIALEPPA